MKLVLLAELVTVQLIRAPAPDTHSDVLFLSMQPYASMVGGSKGSVLHHHCVNLAFSQYFLASNKSRSAATTLMYVLPLAEAFGTIRIEICCNAADVCLAFSLQPLVSSLSTDEPSRKVFTGDMIQINRGLAEIKYKVPGETRNSTPCFRLWRMSNYGSS